MIDSIHPSLLALLSALSISIARTLYRSVLLHLGAGTTALASGSVSLVLIWIYYFYSGRVEHWPLQGVAWFMLIGVMGGFGGRYLHFFSMKELGLARTAIILQTSIVWSTGLAIVLLGERLNLAIGAGTVAIMIGSILLVHREETGLKKIPFAYYLIPVVAAFLQGFSLLLRKYGYAWIDSAPLGMSISNTFSVMTMMFIMPFTHEGIPKTWGRQPVFFIVVGAVFNALAALFFWTAIQHGELVQVVPITRISVLLMIFASWLFYRKLERITARVVYGGLLSVFGVFLVVLGK